MERFCKLQMMVFVRSKFMYKYCCAVYLVIILTWATVSLEIRDGILAGIHFLVLVPFKYWVEGDWNLWFLVQRYNWSRVFVIDIFLFISLHSHYSSEVKTITPAVFNWTILRIQSSLASAGSAYKRQQGKLKKKGGLSALLVKASCVKPKWHATVFSYSSCFLGRFFSICYCANSAEFVVLT